MTIDGSQHLIVNYNDGTTNDLGAIFQGNVNISGNLTADSIIENMSGYSASIISADFVSDYVGCVKNGNKITFAIAGVLTTENPHPDGGYAIVKFTIPSGIGAKLFPHWGSVLDLKNILCLSSEYTPPVATYARVMKFGNNDIRIYILTGGGALAVSTSYYFRFEATFLLSDSLA